ncbi:hypothetical protein Tco_1320092 [Tanacetum coccineum]
MYSRCSLGVVMIIGVTATIENWPQPCGATSSISTLGGNALNWFKQTTYAEALMGFEECGGHSALNFTQRKKCAKKPCRAFQGKTAPSVPQTFDELMKRTRSFIQGEAAMDPKWACPWAFGPVSFLT